MKSDKEDLYVMEAKSFYLNEKFLDKTFIDLVLYNSSTSLKLFTVTTDSLLCIFSESTR